MYKKWMVLSLSLALVGLCHAQGTLFSPTIGTTGSEASVYHSGNGGSTNAGGEIGGYSVCVRTLVSPGQRRSFWVLPVPATGLSVQAMRWACSLVML